MHSFGAADRVVVLPSARRYRACTYEILYVYVHKILKYRSIDHFTALPHTLFYRLAAIKFSRTFMRCFLRPSAILNFAVSPPRLAISRQSPIAYCPLYLRRQI